MVPSSVSSVYFGVFVVRIVKIFIFHGYLLSCFRPLEKLQEACEVVHGFPFPAQARRVAVGG